MHKRETSLTVYHNQRNNKYMPEGPSLPLRKIRKIEKAVTWEDFCEDINLFIDFIQKHFVVEIDAISSIAGVVISDVEPNASERDKIWINNTSPYFIATFAGGQWQKFYKYVKSDSAEGAVEDLIWIKTIEPYALGAYIDGSWEMFYNYPRKVPMKWLLTNALPVGMRDASSTEIADLELAAPTNAKWKWVVFDPN